MTSSATTAAPASPATHTSADFTSNGDLSSPNPKATAPILPSILYCNNNEGGGDQRIVDARSVDAREDWDNGDDGGDEEDAVSVEHAFSVEDAATSMWTM